MMVKREEPVDISNHRGELGKGGGGRRGERREVGVGGGGGRRGCEWSERVCHPTVCTMVCNYKRVYYKSILL